MSACASIGVLMPISEQEMARVEATKRLAAVLAMDMVCSWVVVARLRTP